MEGAKQVTTKGIRYLSRLERNCPHASKVQAAVTAAETSRSCSSGETPSDHWTCKSGDADGLAAVEPISGLVFKTLRQYLHGSKRVVMGAVAGMPTLLLSAGELDLSAVVLIAETN